MCRAVAGGCSEERVSRASALESETREEGVGGGRWEGCTQ